MYKNGMTKTAISARVGNQLGKGQVGILRTRQESGNMVLYDSGEVVDVFNMHGRRIAPNIHVSICFVDGHWSIGRFPAHYAVRIPGMSSVYFLLELPDNADGLDIEEEAWVEVPSNVLAWPEGARRPETVLCRSKANPKHYKLFKYPDEVEGTVWEETGEDFGGTFSAKSWEQFAEKLKALHSIPDEEGA